MCSCMQAVRIKTKHTGGGRRHRDDDDDDDDDDVNAQARNEAAGLRMAASPRQQKSKVHNVTIFNRDTSPISSPWRLHHQQTGHNHATRGEQSATAACEQLPCGTVSAEEVGQSISNFDSDADIHDFARFACFTF